MTRELKKMTEKNKRNYEGVREKNDRERKKRRKRKKGGDGIETKKWLEA